MGGLFREPRALDFPPPCSQSATLTGHTGCPPAATPLSEVRHRPPQLASGLGAFPSSDGSRPRKGQEDMAWGDSWTNGPASLLSLSSRVPQPQQLPPCPSPAGHPRNFTGSHAKGLLEAHLSRLIHPNTCVEFHHFLGTELAFSLWREGLVISARWMTQHCS